MSSSLLEQAVIDAEALKEAALKNAESVVLEKYSGEVKAAVDSLLEQEEDDMDMLPGDVMGEPEEREDIVDEIPLSALDGENACPCPEEDEEVVLDLDKIAALADMEADDVSLGDEETGLMEEKDSKPDFLDLDKDGNKEEPMKKAAEEKELAEDQDPGMDKEEIPGLEGPIQFGSGTVLYWDPKEGKYYNRGQDMYLSDEEAEKLIMQEEEDVDLSEEELSEIMEELVVDLENVASGAMFRTHPTKTEEETGLDVAIAKEQDTAFAEQQKELRQAIERLQEQNKSLKLQKNKLVEGYEKLKGIAEEATSKLEELNFSNVKLVYTNRALKSDSLNERQKEKLVEAISNVDSVEEAKIVFETLNQNVVTKSDKAPRNLSEAVSKNNQLILKSNKEKQPANRNQVDRMKKLAGLI